MVDEGAEEGKAAGDEERLNEDSKNEESLEVKSMSMKRKRSRGMSGV